LVVFPDAPDLSGRCEEFHLYDFGQRIVLKLQLENTGINDADEFRVAFYLSSSGSTLGEPIGEERLMGGLNSNHTKKVTFRYESLTPLSGYQLSAVIDPDSQVLELDETNNKVVVTIP